VLVGNLATDYLHVVYVWLCTVSFLLNPPLCLGQLSLQSVTLSGMGEAYE